ncbi:MAG: DNA packaging protein [Rhodanobacter sp.]
MQSGISDADSRERLKELLSDRNWRLTHLYYIVDKNGDVVLFQPNAVQLLFLIGMHNRNMVLKSRQHGITTIAALLALDTALFRSNTTCGLVMHKQGDAEKVFKGKILFAYDRLPDWLKAARVIVRRDMTGELEFSNGSKIYVSLSHRSGTLQFLHVSEYGPMCAFYPLRASEVKTGALNTLSPDAIATIESTAHGRIGDYYQMCQRSMQLDKMVAAGTAALTKLDYKFHFFAWFQDPINEIDPEGVVFPSELLAYFQRLEDEHGIVLNERKRAWYSKKSEEQGDKMKQEHPSTPEEAFEQAIEGAYYSREFGKALKEGRVCDLPIIPGVPVNTFWDIGMSDTTAIWFHQQIGVWHHFIDFYENSGEQAEHYVRALRDKGYLYGKHYLPHDGVNTEWAGTGNKTRLQILQDLLPGKVELVDRIENLQDGIDMVRQSLPRCRFDRTRCGENPPGSGRGGISSLQSYRKAWNEKLDVWHDYPLHDWASNGADAFRQFAQGHPMNGVNDVSTRAKRRTRDRNWRTT